MGDSGFRKTNISDHLQGQGALQLGLIQWGWVCRIFCMICLPSDLLKFHPEIRNTEWVDVEASQSRPPTHIFIRRNHHLAVFVSAAYPPGSHALNILSCVLGADSHPLNCQTPNSLLESPLGTYCLSKAPMRIEVTHLLWVLL